MLLPGSASERTRAVTATDSEHRQGARGVIDSATMQSAADAIRTVLEKFSTSLAQITRANEIPDTSAGFRPENDAEHSYELALVAIVVADLIDQDLDRGLVARLALVHDLEEIYCGDVSVFDPASSSDTRAAEKDAAGARVLDDLRGLSPAVAADFQIYLERTYPEAHFVYALDKIVPFFRVLHNGRHHAHPSLEEYRARYATARSKIAEYPPLLPVFEHVYDEVGARLPDLNSN